MKGKPRSWQRCYYSLVALLLAIIAFSTTHQALAVSVNGAHLKATPSEFRYPFHRSPGQAMDETVSLHNSGDSTATWSVTSSASFVSIIGATSGQCGIDSLSSSSFVIRVTGPIDEGLYTGSLEVAYSSLKSPDQSILYIPINLYNFTNFYLPQNAPLRTSNNRLGVNQASQVAAGLWGHMFTYFSDGSSYLREGHLILGNDVLNLSYSVFDGIGIPTPNNPFGYTYAATWSMSYDSLFATYRTTFGRGFNRDSTIGFNIRWYASKHPDSCDFYVGQFKVYKGPKNPIDSVNNLSIAYYTDWDVPSDSGFDNTCGSIPSRAAIWQRGAWSAVTENRYGATAVYKNDGNDIVGGWVLDNPTYIYPDNGYENDSLWNIMETLTQGTYRLYTGVPEDLSGSILIHRDLTINGATNDTVRFVVVLAGTRAGGLTGVTTALDKAQKFLCGLGLAPDAEICTFCLCGDANNTGTINVSDAVFVINYVFAGGASPSRRCLGDANGTGSVNISDAVYIINFIFGGGPDPFCP